MSDLCKLPFQISIKCVQNNAWHIEGYLSNLLLLPDELTDESSAPYIQEGNMQDSKLHTLVSDLLFDLGETFSDEKTVREVACDICKIVLSKLKERFGNDHIDMCALLAFLDWLNILELKGAAGFQTCGSQRWTKIHLGEGIIGRAALTKKIIITNNLKNESHVEKGLEADIVKLGEKIALIAYPLVLSTGTLVGVLVVGKFNNNPISDNFFNSPDYEETMAQYSKQVATIHNHAVALATTWRSKKYTNNEKQFIATVKSFYRNAPPAVDTKKFMDHIALMLMKILNAGNLETPFYKNYLFYEYQHYRGRYILRSYGKRPGDFSSFSLQSRIYKNYIEDGLVKSVESQKLFIQNRGREPHIIRHIRNKIEEIAEKLDADWSPCGSGSTFIVPLFEDKRPLGVLVFLSRHQNRQYINSPQFYLGWEKRQNSLYDLKVFRSLQPLIANEYFKLRVDEERQRGIDDLESILSAIKEIILLEDRGEVLNRLAKFTAQSLNSEGCLIYLLNRSKNQLELGATSGFQPDEAIRKELTFSLQPSADHPKGPPLQVFENQKSIIINRGGEFRRFCGNQKRFWSFFKQLKSGRVISYLSQPIGKLGVIEVFNKSKFTPTAWSFFEEQDTITLRHISEAIATVLNRMQATATQVQTEKVKVVDELLLDISHELKNPLFSSLIFVRKLKETLNGQMASATGNGTLQTVELIERNIDKAQRILRSMQNSQNLIMSQMNSQKVDLEKILRLVLQTNQASCEQQKITIGSEFLANEPFVFGDELQLNQVFTNLVKNAIDAMPNGGMLAVRLFEVDGAMQVEIADTGSGIPEAIKDRVFEPFVTTKDADNGTGLGLTLSQRIIKQHKGKIEFESELGWGTRFLVILPKYVEPTFLPVKQLELQTIPK